MFAQQKKNKRKTALRSSDRYLTSKEKKALLYYESRRLLVELKKAAPQSTE